MQKMIITIAAVLLLCSCYKDKGNYSYIDYNGILTTNAFANVRPNPVSVVLGDTIRIHPAFTWKYETDDTLNFSYEWDQLDSMIYDKRDLVYSPKTTGAFGLNLYVTDNKTQIKYRFQINCSVNSPYKGGWLMLTDNGGASSLDFIRRDKSTDPNNPTAYNFVRYQDVYSKLYPEDHLGTDPLKLVTEAYPDYNFDQVVVLQGGGGSVFLSGDDFSKIINLKSEFPGQAIPGGASPVDYVDAGTSNEELMDDGNLYWKQNTTFMGGIHTGQFFTVPYYFSGGAHISKIIDNLLDNSSFIYMYDDLNSRFIAVYASPNSMNSYLGTKLDLVDNSAPPAGFVSLNNQKGYKFIYASQYANASYFMDIIKNNATGQYLYQTYQTTMQYTSLGISGQTQEVFAGNGLVTDKTIYKRIGNSSYLFFGEGSQLYFYDVNTKKVTRYADFGSGNITQLETDATSSELGVALDNGSFYIVSLDNTNLGTADPSAKGILYQATGLGKIVDMKWKWGSYYNHLFGQYPS